MINFKWHSWSLPECCPCTSLQREFNAFSCSVKNAPVVQNNSMADSLIKTVQHCYKHSTFLKTVCCFNIHCLKRKTEMQTFTMKNIHFSKIMIILFYSWLFSWQIRKSVIPHETMLFDVILVFFFFYLPNKNVQKAVCRCVIQGFPTSAGSIRVTSLWV